MPVQTLEELQEALSEASLRAEETDAAMQNLAPDVEDGVIEELEVRFESQTAEVAKIAAAIQRKEKMNRALAEARPNTPTEPRKYGEAVRTNEPLTYRRASEGGSYSFFSDLYQARQGEPAAQARLARHSREMQVLGVGGEERAITSSSGGPGLVVPLYFVDQIALFARAGRPFADALGPRPLPDTGVSFLIPRVTTGSTAAVQSEGNAVNDSSAVTDDITLALNTVAGKMDLSRQLAERSNPAADEIIAQDLAADYAKQLDTQLLTQATNGVLNLSGTNGVTFTTGSPTVALAYPKIADAIRQVHVNRFMPPNLVVMGPTRWAWFLAALDTQSRPLIVPNADQAIQSFNPVGAQNRVVPQGLVGTIQGLPILVDPNIPVNLGASTNEDRIIVTRTDDQVLYESGSPTVRVYEEVLSGNLQIRVLAYGYFAFSFARFPKSNSVISGTGLVQPTF